MALDERDARRASSTRAVLPYAIALSYALMLIAPLPAQADPLDGIALSWDAPDTCPEAGEVARAARRLLPEHGHYEPTDIIIVVDEPVPGQGLRLRFTARSTSTSSERELHLATCDDARQAGALLVALTLDPDAVAELPPPEAAPIAPNADSAAQEQPAQPAPQSLPLAGAPERPEAPPAAPEGAPPPALLAASAPGKPAAHARRDSRSTLGAFVLAGAIVDSAALPSPAFGLAVAGGLSLAALRIALRGSWFPGAEHDFGIVARGGARASLIAAGLSVCGAWPLATHLRLGPCVGGEVGRYTAQSYGVARSGHDSTRWLAGTLAVESTVEIAASFSLVASLGLVLPAVRPTLRVEQAGTAYAVPALTARGALALQWK